MICNCPLENPMATYPSPYQMYLVMLPYFSGNSMLLGWEMLSYLNNKNTLLWYTSENIFSSFSYCCILRVDQQICLGSYLKSVVVKIVSPELLENVIVLSRPTVTRIPLEFQSQATIFLECLFTHGILRLAVLE